MFGPKTYNYYHVTVLKYEPSYFYILRVLPLWRMLALWHSVYVVLWQCVCSMFYDTYVLFADRQGRVPTRLPEWPWVPTPRLRERQRHGSRDSAEDHEHCGHEGVSHTQRVPSSQREEETTAKTHPQLMNSINEHYLLRRVESICVWDEIRLDRSPVYRVYVL